MKEKNRGAGIGIGGVSILAVFVVLCLTTLAALSYTTAQADHRLAERNARAQESYYEADAAAEQRLAEIVQMTTGNADFRNTLRQAEYTMEDNLVSFRQPIDTARFLQVEVLLELDGNGIPTGGWSRVRWQTEIQPEPESRERLTLLK